jgi:glucose/mannose transport system permease protein
MAQRFVDYDVRTTLRNIGSRRAILYLLTIGFTAFFLIPLWTGLMTAFKTNGAVISSLPFVPPGQEGFTLEKLLTAFDRLAPGIASSLLMTIPATIFDVLLASMAAYAISLSNWRGQKTVLLLFVIAIFLPKQIVIVPLANFWTNIFPLTDYIGWLWTLPILEPHHGPLVELIITHIAYGIPICTLLFYGYYQTLPTSLIESAKIDGSSFTKVYTRIVMPLSKPMIGVVFIFQFTQIWNELLFALTIIGDAGDPAAPVTLVLSDLGAALTGVDFGLRMSGAFIAALPTLLIYVLFAEQFAKGLQR